MQELHFLDPGVGLWEMALGRPSMEGTEQPADSTPASGLGVGKGGGCPGLTSVSWVVYPSNSKSSLVQHQPPGGSEEHLGGVCE